MFKYAVATFVALTLSVNADSLDDSVKGLVEAASLKTWTWTYKRKIPGGYCTWKRVCTIPGGCMRTKEQCAKVGRARVSYPKKTQSTRARHESRQETRAVMNPTKPESSSANGLFKTGLPKTVVTPLDKQIWASQNRLRVDPAYFIKYLEKQKTCFQPGSFVNTCGRIGLRTQEGVPAIDEAIRALKKQKPLKPMKWEDGLYLAVRDHCLDQGSSGATGHSGSDGSSPFQRIDRYGRWSRTAGENISYGSKTGDSIIMQLFVDDGVASRGHRHNLQKAAFGATGICTGKHSRYRFMCTLIYSGAGYKLNAAGAAKIKQLGGKVV